MALISELVTEVKAKTTDFNKGIDSAKAKALDFTLSAKTMQTAFVAAFAGIAASAGIVYKVLSDAIEQVDQLGKASQKAGVDFESFQSLKYAADLSDVSINTLQASMGKMSVFVKQANDGLKENNRILNSIGLSAKDLINLPVDQQFEKIASALKNVENPTEQRADVRSIFGRGGLEMMPLLKDDIRGLRQEWESYGVTLSDTQFKQAQTFNDTKQKIEDVKQAFVQNVGANTAPAFNVLAENILDTITKMGGLKQASKDISESLINVIKTLTQLFNIAKDIMSQAMEAASTINTTIGNGPQKLANLTENAVNSLIRNGIETQFKNIFSGKGSQNVITSPEFYKGVGNDAMSLLRDASKTASGVLKGISPISNTTIQFDSIIANLSKSMDTAANTTKKASKDVEELGKTSQKASKALDNIFGSNPEQEGVNYINKNLPKGRDQAVDPDFNRLLGEIRDEFAASGGKVTNRIQMDLALARQIARTSGGLEVGLDENKNPTFKELSNSGMLNAVKVLEDYINGKMQKEQEVKISVEPTDLFIVKVAKNSYTQKTVQQFVNDTIANAAIGAAK